MFAFVKCKCGRMLRARRSPTRTTITCWDCRSEVVVPRFKSAEGPSSVDRLRGAMSAPWAETAAAVILLALATTALIAAPVVGVWLAMGMLVTAAFTYVRRIEHAGRSMEPADAPKPATAAGERFGRAAGRLLLATGLVGGLVLVPWLADGSQQVEPARPILPPPTLLVLGIVLLVALPAAVYLTTARDGDGTLGPRRAMAAARKRKGASTLAILLPLLAISAMEATLFGVLVATKNIGVFTYDLFPIPPGDRIDHTVYVSDGDVAFSRQEYARRVYAHGLRRGATLVGSVPISFNRGLAPRVIVPAYGTLGSEAYLLARLGITLAVVLTLLTALMFQADLFGRISLAAPDDDEDDEGEGEDEGKDDAEPLPPPSASQGRTPVEAGTTPAG
ncbi:hypothetical protein [Tautonia plasticadhaerens]|uniref:Uncharacterized protein n=1 Tax=Tautonia plasticadhaerens TaxID=2527974 RepID=A0A518HCR2_9BACT|nr:hypothetical protein [Tautonia plasticadhaerens]QDV38651.1 hypothetical protein ElP_66060 [Tautonia plasticadhaerens]